MAKKSPIYIEIANRKDVEGIINVLKQNLIEIRDIEEISKEKRKKLEQEGFLRREVDIEYYIKLIDDPNADIYVAKNDNEEIIGFASIHRKKYDILKVRDVIGALSFENEKTKNLLLNEDTEFTYLDQISILPEYKRWGVGTAIFQKSLKIINTPIVAFIVEEPIFNKASFYWHIRNGFEFSAVSIGEYKGKVFKFQIFVHWND